MNEVYQPGEDTLFLCGKVEGLRANRVAEIGVGSGFVLRHYISINSPDLAIGTDVDTFALNMARERDESECVEYLLCKSCDCLREGSFQLIFFNPPYLRNEGEEDLAVSGGEKGIETTYEMVISSHRALGSGGLMVFLASSLSDIDYLLRKLRDMGMDVTKLGSIRLFFEELMAFEVAKANQTSG